jgi:hypothetical protein
MQGKVRPVGSKFTQTNIAIVRRIDDNGRMADPQIVNTLRTKCNEVESLIAAYACHCNVAAIRDKQFCLLTVCPQFVPAQVMRYFEQALRL